MSTVEVRKEGDHYTAVDTETGTRVQGETREAALLYLAVAVKVIGDLNDRFDASVELSELFEGVDDVVDWIDHMSELSEEYERKIETGRKQYANGEFSSLEDLRERMND